MTAGSGIFFGFLCLSLVLLYMDTKDRWNWEKLIKNILLGIACFVFIVLCYVFKSSSSSNAVDEEWTWNYLFIRICVLFTAFFFAVIPMYVIESIYKFREKDFQYDENGIERSIHKFFIWLSVFLFLFLMFFCYDFLLGSATKLANEIYKSFR